MVTDETTASAESDTSKDVSKTAQDNVNAKDNGDGTNTDTDAKSADKPKSDDDTHGLKKALNETRKERDALLKAQRDAELAKLPELERTKSELDELTKRVEKLDIENRRYKVAMKLGLPWSIGKRLTGDTDDEMEADGAELAKAYKIDDQKKIIDDPKNKKPPNDAKRAGGAGQPGMNDILRALRRG